MSITISSEVLGTLSVTVAETTGVLSVSVLATAPAVLTMELGTPGPSPTITVGAPVTIPEDYVGDLGLRLSLYRRMSTLESDEEIEEFGAEIVDRFGPLPEEVNQLLKLVSIKALCRKAHVEKVEAGPKGVIVSFRDNSFANPHGLVRFVGEQGARAKVRPDMKVVFIADLADADERLEGARRILREWPWTASTSA